ncbi:MAG TPA: ATP-binding cassette domain-containing protein [Candidatus Saccharimonadales bacterium]|nr:ATP-binding cassette domain-containing protein [Candidatus Saccharimonadales bacterium]
MTVPPAVSLTRLTYRYPGGQADALDVRDLRIGDGLILVTGDSGSGKSSLLRVFNGLVPHFHGGTIGGSALVCGHDVNTTATRVLATEVGFVFQDPELQSVYPTVERDVAFGLENIAVPPSAMPGRVAEALERTGIAHLRDRAVATLSGGERQRLALAGVLAMQPRVLVLDEPLSQLDEDGARSVVAILEALAGSGTAVIVAEHRLDQLGVLGGRVLAMHGGRVVDPVSRAAARIIEAPMTPAAPYTAPSSVAWQLSGVATGPARTPLLEGICLEGRDSEVVALVGPNGGGKTTLLRTIAGLLVPLSGRVHREPGRVAFLPQNPMALLHRATVAAEVAWTVRGDPPSGDAAMLLAELGLAHLAHRDPRDLSSGERQRAAIAAVLAGQPRIALLDEPTRGMDTTARDALCRAIHRLRSAGSSIVIATHDRNLVAAIADRTVAVGAGAARELVPVAVA